MGGSVTRLQPPERAAFTGGFRVSELCDVSCVVMCWDGMGCGVSDVDVV